MSIEKNYAGLLSVSYNAQSLHGSIDAASDSKGAGLQTKRVSQGSTHLFFPQSSNKFNQPTQSGEDKDADSDEHRQGVWRQSLKRRCLEE